MNANTPKPVLVPQIRGTKPATLGEVDDDVRRTGRVTFDARGNAVWEWALGNGAFGTDVSSTRLKRLEESSLSIAADQVPTAVHDNPLGAKIGYHPYESGRLTKTAAPERRKDLRRLGESLRLKKQYEAMKKADGTTQD